MSVKVPQHGLFFKRDRDYGGTPIESVFEPIPLKEPRGRILEESEQFILWRIVGIVAEGVDTAHGAADKGAFLCSRIEDPANRVEVSTFSSSLVERITESNDAAEEILRDNGDKNPTAERIAELVNGSDMPAVVTLQRVQSSRNEGVKALVMSFVCPLSQHGFGPQVKAALRKAMRDGVLAGSDEDNIPF